MDLGLSLTLTRFLAHARAERDRDQINELASTYSLVFLALSLLAVIVSGAIAAPMAAWIHAPSRFVSSATGIFLAIAIANSLALTGRTLESLLTAHLRIDLVNLAFAFGAFVTLVASATLLWQGGTLAGAALMMLIGSTCTLALLVVFVARSGISSVEFAPRHFSVGALAATAGLGLYASIASAAAQITFSTDYLVIGAGISVSSVAAYAVAFSLANFCRQGIAKVGDVLLPYVSTGQTNLGRSKLVYWYILGARISVALAVVLGCGLLLFGRQAIDIWVGHGNFVGYPVLVALVVPLVIGAASRMAGVTLIGLNDLRGVAIISAVEAVANLALSILFVRLYGVLGVALATVLTQVGLSGWYMPWYCNRLLGLSWRSYLNRVVMPAVWPVIPAAAVAWAITKQYERHGPEVGVVALGLILLSGIFVGCFVMQLRFSQFIKVARAVPIEPWQV